MTDMVWLEWLVWGETVDRLEMTEIKVYSFVKYDSFQILAAMSSTSQPKLLFPGFSFFQLHSIDDFTEGSTE